MKKKRQQLRARRQVLHTKSILLFSIVAGLLILIWYNHQQNSILGATSVIDQPTTTAQLPTATVQPTTKSIQPSTSPSLYPSITTSPPLPSASTSPTPILPKEPIYVPVVQTPGSSAPISQVDIAAAPATVIVDNPPSGTVTTSTQELTLKNEPVSINVTIEQSNNQSNPPTLYQQVYTPTNQSAPVPIEPEKTLNALNLWLSLNETKMTPTENSTFSIAQGGKIALVSPNDNKIAVNLSRMEVLINTSTGYKPLSYSVKKVTDYVVDSGFVSTIDGLVTIVDSPIELRYDIKGTSNQYLLAFIPVPIPKEVCISAKTGEVCGIQQSLVSRIVDMLSI